MANTEPRTVARSERPDVPSPGDAELERLLTSARAAVTHGGSRCADRLFAVVVTDATSEASCRLHRALTHIVAELGFAGVSIFRARATAAHAARALELLESRLQCESPGRSGPSG